MQRKANDAYGVQSWLRKQNIHLSKRKFNSLLVEFLKSKSLPYKKWNNNYKGLNTPDLINSEIVQEHWNEFKEWFLNNKNNE